MIESSIEELFTSINNSIEYKEYLSITEELSNNKEVMNLINEIKNLEKEATKLEYNCDDRYIEMDHLIQEKTNILNNNLFYKDYLSKLKKFNNTLLASASIIEEYLNDKVTIK